MEAEADMGIVVDMATVPVLVIGPQQQPPRPHGQDEESDRPCQQPQHRRPTPHHHQVGGTPPPLRVQGTITIVTTIIILHKMMKALLEGIYNFHSSKISIIMI